MPAYAVGIVPLLSMISLGKSDKEEDRTYQVAYADDLAGGGNVLNLRSWWDKLLEKGPPLGYFPKASKLWLIVKEDKLEEAKELLRGTEIKITSVGKRYFGGFIEKESARNDYFKDLVDDFVSQIDTLSNIACSQPQAAFSIHTWISAQIDVPHQDHPICV